MVVSSDKHPKWHMVLVGLICCVKCYAVTEVLIGPSAACVRPEYVLNSVGLIELHVTEEFPVYSFHLPKEVDSL